MASGAPILESRFYAYLSTRACLKVEALGSKLHQPRGHKCYACRAYVNNKGAVALALLRPALFINHA